MNIETVASNLRNTIAGKEMLLETYKNPMGLARSVLTKSIRETMTHMLEINITELKRILQDVEQCRPEWTPSNCPYAAAETCHRMD